MYRNWTNNSKFADLSGRLSETNWHTVLTHDFRTRTGGKLWRKHLLYQSSDGS